MSEYRIHPVFGILTDPEDIAVFDRQQAKKDSEQAYLEAQQQAEYEAKCESKQNMNISFKKTK